MAQDDTIGTTVSFTEGGNRVEPFAAQILTALCERQTVSAAGVRQIALDYLVRAILAKDGFDPVLVLEELRGFRLTQDGVIDLYIPHAAIRTGDMWMCSDITFADVTVAALRLQSLLGEASNGLIWLGQEQQAILHALIVVPENEQHFLGASVVAAQLRRAGCEVSLAISETRKQIVSRVLADKPDMVLFSCARIAALESVVKIIKKVKTSASRVPVLALGGPLRGNSDGIKEQTGVDIVSTNATDVMSFCAKRKKALHQS